MPLNYEAHPESCLEGDKFILDGKAYTKDNLILISSAITSQQKSVDLQLNTIELCLAEIKLEGMGKNLVIGSLYRRPKTSCVEFVCGYEKLINHIKNENTNLILGMDHNTDLLKASVHNSTQHFLEVNLDNSLYPCITKPMRLTNNSVMLIDNVFIYCNLLGR